MSTKKLAIYISIIVLTVGGTIFMLYQNRQPSGQSVLPVDNLEQSLSAESMVSGGEATPGQGFSNQGGAAGQPNQSLSASEIKDGSEIDLSIFGSKKFRALKENILISQEAVKPGKRNPFQPD
jgi:hypothetical protein